MEVLKKGSVEPLLVPVRDRLNNITTLTGVSSLLFDTKKKSDNAAVETSVPVTLDPDWPMTAICLITTTLSGYVGGEEYKLYLKYTAGSEAPVLGPIFFRVEDD
jgi:hypothetical protein